jgi:SNF2 family DNA or RNA helicase
MPYTKSYCDKCGKIAEGVKQFEIGSQIVWLLKCGHIMPQKMLEEKHPEDIISLDGKKLYQFQNDGVRFVEKSGGRCLIGDEQGVGKTIQALAALHLHEDMTPFLWIGKSSLKYQYQYEVMRWMGENAFAQILDSSKSILLPNMTGYIISYDLLRRMNGSFVDEVASKIKTIVLDECQQVKNSDSARTKYTRHLCSKVPNVIALSGTPIMNHAAEYFPILNILRPDLYPHEASFIRFECESYWNGFAYKVGGLANPEKFKAKTKNFIIRRTRDEVLPDLPKIDRQYQFHELSKAVEKAYIETFKAFRTEYLSTSSGKFEESSNILAYLSRMRHLTGLSKIDPCIDHVMEFLGSTDDKKIVIFIHHKDVGSILADKLNIVLDELELARAVQLTADLDDLTKHERTEEFRTNPKRRVLIASTKGFGEGLNLQFCSDCIILERQWNPSSEEQAEGRFPRPGNLAASIRVVYFVAVGTVDEFFAELVEKKREIVAKTLGMEAVVEWDQSSLMRELAQILASNGGSKWSI